MSTGLSQAQEPPNLVGTWKGMAQAVGIGPTPYRLPDGPGPVFFDKEMEFTYTITEQHGARFIGNMSSGSGKETLIGALQAPAFTSGTMLDDDGRYSVSVRDAGTIDVCYDHLYPKNKVVSCFTLKKQ
ncbi:hypothetical protein MWN33_05285 [Starkeya koreensis]|uniref:Lipocalin-like domain-containing protein n=1 Tax=Ancylobacter koreensis TaxID=266121 RepID=A0ABT0DJS7_9HYPH|nr:hypothetical protein [Ancylobacter koreensis]MCK0207444.1 hypothetical protein [Ancylobacter koreensis]